jgi:hypothetical protein
MWVAYNSMQCTSLVDFDIYMVTWFISEKKKREKRKWRCMGILEEK